MGRRLNEAAFALAALLSVGLEILFALDPAAFLLMSFSTGRFDGRTAANLAPLLAAAILPMFIVPAAVRQGQAGRWRKAWLRLGLSYGAMLFLAFPVRMLVWKLLADF